MKPLVSILIPAHNAAPWVAATLESALAQTWEDKEIIVVDDGSTDRTLEIAKSFVPRGVRVLAQSNRGASAARNLAWANSTGDWLQFLDADDLLDPHKISAQMALAGKLGPGFAYCARWTRFTETIADSDFTPQPLCRDADPVKWLAIKLRDNLMMHPAAWLVSRALADRAGTWDTSLTLDDDGEFFSRVVLASDGIRHCDAAISYYRSNIRGSLSRRKTSVAWQSAFESLKMTGDRLLARNATSSTEESLANAFQRLAFAMYPDEPTLVRKCEYFVKLFGGSRVEPGGGPIFTFVSRTLGWKAARLLRHYRGSWSS
jgi:glycosyltransferase involved in cell wall biosynthesis